MAPRNLDEPAFKIGHDSGSARILFAGVGDAHGHVLRLVGMLREWEARAGRRFAFVLQVGDFEPHRDPRDLESNPCPVKYRHVGDFPLFAEGQETLPWPIVFIGGNHEPWAYLEESPEGGQIRRRDGQPISNCYYIGRSSWASLFGMRVAGISGIFANEARFNEERPASDRIGRKDVSLRSYSYIRRGDIERARAIAESVAPHVWLLHDWPETDLGRRLDHEPRYAGKGANPHTMRLLEEHPAQIALCGHLHARRTWALGATQVHALGYVPRGDAAAFAIFEWDGAARQIRVLSE